MRWILRLARLGADALLAFASLLGLLMRSCRRSPGEVGAFVSCVTVDDMLAKYGGIEAMLRDDLPGFFSGVIRLHYDAPGDREVVLGPRVKAVEMHVPWDRLRLTHCVHVAARLAELHARHGLKMIHARNLYECGMAAWLASRCTGVPYCLSIHQDYDARYARAGRRAVPAYLGVRWLAKMQERWLIRRTPMVLAIRDNLGDYLRGCGARPDQIRMLPHGIDVKPFARPRDPRSFRRKLALPPACRVVNAVGRLGRERYCADTVDIAKQVAAEWPDVVFLMVGDGPERRPLAERIRTEGLGETVRLLGFLDHADVIAVLIHSDISLCTAGGFSLIEACAAGNAIVAYDVEWHREIVHDGETGRLVPAGDVAAAARAICDLLAHPRLAARLGRNARAESLSRHTLVAHDRTRRAHYEALLRSPRVGQSR